MGIFQVIVAISILKIVDLNGFSSHAFIIYQAGVSENGDLLIQQKKEIAVWSFEACETGVANFYDVEQH